MAEPGGPGGLWRPGRGRVRDPSLGISPLILPHPPPPARARAPESRGGDLEGRGLGGARAGLAWREAETLQSTAHLPSGHLRTEWSAATPATVSLPRCVAVGNQWALY